ncbi:MAG: hypothetical protein HYU31_10730 [Deltaproteobacteria bacterium]|nr:hypothetical protein [Deltaproteobacteria bacterium]MBI2368402.1 hypothetical protein [Deltaproteobacteria bacterium]
MIFLIQYNRPSGKIVRLKEFEDSQRRIAEDARLALELELIGKKDGDEVCLLEARSQEALRLTHRRYFESLRTLTASGSSTVASLDKP